ncbi:MAG: flagellar export protein FliJ [Oscillospiraceae bacterium]|jgi:flagellar FliJ protein|nr:flagellar export protein FliJ [Oscillospiraceae bacterium]
MKKFVFTLQSVLNVKRAQEKQRMGELTECNARIRKSEAILEECLAHERAQNAQYLKDLQQGLTPFRLQCWGWAHRAIRERIDYRRKVLEQAEGERVRIQKALVTAMQERKMLEILREKQWEEYRAEERKENDAVIAEFVGHRIFENEQA